MTPADLQAIRTRADAATEGPWKHSGLDYFEPEQPVQVIDDANGNLLIEVPHNTGRDDPQAVANAIFIAASRTNISALLSYITELEQALRGVLTAIDEHIELEETSLCDHDVDWEREPVIQDDPHCRVCAARRLMDK